MSNVSAGFGHVKGYSPLLPDLVRIKDKSLTQQWGIDRSCDRDAPIGIWKSPYQQVASADGFSKAQSYERAVLGMNL